MNRSTNLVLIAVIAGGLGWLAAVVLPSGAPEADPELTLLIRFMAILKAAMAVVATALSAWRLTHPASARLAGGYCVATALMAAAPGLIWEMSHIIAGAVVFHAGLAIFLVCAWADRGLATEMFSRRVARRAASVPALRTRAT